MNQASYGIAITADDKTAKGVKSAEKRIGQIPKHVSAVNRRALEHDQRRVRASAKSIVKTFGEVERAGAKLFGGNSVVGGITSRLGSLGEVSRAAGSGLAEASAAGGLLEGTLAGVGAAAATTVGVLVAAAAASWKFADGWSKSASSIGRTASIIGVSTKALQEFQGAAERLGVDKGAAGSAIGGLSETLNDARYGRNVQALAVLQRLGVGLKLNKDGTVNVDAMLPAIADAIGRQNSSGRRTAARALGINEEAIPVFAQGGKALSADMKDFGKRGAVVTDSDVALANRIQRRDVELRQRVDRGVLDLQRRNAEVVKGAGDLIGGGAAEFKHTVTNWFAPAAEKIDRAASRIAAASGGVVAAAGRFSAKQIGQLARRAAPLAAEAMSYGFTPAEAKGIAANMVLESGGRTHAHERGGSGAGRGLIQWTDPARKRRFREIMGVDVDDATRDQQWRFLRWELGHTHARQWRRALSHGQSSPDIAYGFSKYVEVSANRERDSSERAAVAAAMGEMPVHVTVELKGAPAGTRATVRAGKHGRPAISHALAG